MGGRLSASEAIWSRKLRERRRRLQRAYGRTSATAEPPRSKFVSESLYMVHRRTCQSFLRLNKIASIKLDGCSQVREAVPLDDVEVYRA